MTLYRVGPLTGIRDKEAIYSATLTSGGRFDIQNIPQHFTDLEIEIVGQSSVAATDDTLLMYANNDTTSTNYRSIIHYGQGAATSTVNDADGARIADIAAASAPTAAPGIIRIWLPDYRVTTFQKTAKATTGFRRDTSQMRESNWIWHWEATTAINRLTIQPDGYATDTLITGTRIRLWGIR